MAKKTKRSFSESQLRKIRIGKRFFLMFLILSFIPLLLAGGITYFKSVYDMRKHAKRYCAQIGSGLHTNVNYLFSGINNVTIKVAYDRDFQSKLFQYRSSTNRSLDYVHGVSAALTEYMQRSIVLNENSIMRASLVVMDSKRKDYQTSTVIETDYQDIKRVSRLVTPEVFNQAVAADGVLVWTGLSAKASAGDGGGAGFLVSRSFSGILQGEKDVGVITLLYNPRYFQSICSNAVEEGDVYLMQRDGTVVFSNQTQAVYKPFEYWRQICNGVEGETPETVATLMAEGGKKIIAWSSFDVNGWRLAYVASVDPLIRDARNSALFIVGLCLLMMVAVAYAARVFSASVNNPVRRLMEVTRSVKNERFDVRAQVDGNDELTLLSESFNDMVRKVEQLIEEVYVAGLREKEFKLMALASQMNPHFLYNALDGIRWTARKNKDFDVAHRIETLSNLFRLALSDNNSLTTFGKEVEFVEYYLFFQKMSFKERLIVQWDVDASVLEYTVIKLLLQPIVENCVIHAMPPGLEALTIQIELKDVGEYVHVCVSDDGVGTDAEIGLIVNRNPEGGKDHIALKNIDDRLKEFFGGGYRLEVESASGVGTVVKVNLPKILKKATGASMGEF